MDDELIPQDLEVEPSVKAPPGPAGAQLLSYDRADNVAGGPKRVKWDHFILIDYMLQNPLAKQNDLAKFMGVTVPWLSRIINTDGFKNKFAERRKEVLGEDGVIAMQEIDERLTALASDSLEKLHEKLHDANPNMDMILKTADLALRAKGYGAKAPGVAVQVNNSFVVALPEKEKDAASWADRYAPITVNAREA